MYKLKEEENLRLIKVIEKFPQIKEIVSRFNEAEIKWAIAAGTAVYIYCGGDESLLDDVDIWVASESKQKVSEILNQKWLPQSSERHKAENITFGVFDIFVNCKKYQEDKQLLDYHWTNLSENHLREEVVDGVSYKIVSPEDIIVLKKPNGREKDKIDILSIEKNNIDEKYLKERFVECCYTII